REPPKRRGGGEKTAGGGFPACRNIEANRIPCCSPLGPAQAGAKEEKDERYARLPPASEQMRDPPCLSSLDHAYPCGAGITRAAAASLRHNGGASCRSGGNRTLRVALANRPRRAAATIRRTSHTVY